MLLKAGTPRLLCKEIPRAVWNYTGRFVMFIISL